MTDKKKHAAMALLLALLGVFGGTTVPGSGSGSGSGNSTPNETGDESTNENESGDEATDEDTTDSGAETPEEEPVVPPDTPTDENHDRGEPYIPGEETPSDEEDPSGEGRYVPDPERHRDEIIGEHGDPEPTPPTEEPAEDPNIPGLIVTAATYYAVTPLRLYEEYQQVQDTHGVEVVGGPPPVFSSVGPSKLLKLGKALLAMGVSVSWIGSAAADEEEDDSSDAPTYTPPVAPEPSEPGDTTGGGGGGGGGGLVIR